MRCEGVAIQQQPVYNRGRLASSCSSSQRATLSLRGGTPGVPRRRGSRWSDLSEKRGFAAAEQKGSHNAALLQCRVSYTSAHFLAADSQEALRGANRIIRAVLTFLRLGHPRRRYLRTPAMAASRCLTHLCASSTTGLRTAPVSSSCPSRPRHRSPPYSLCRAPRGEVRLHF